MGIMQAAPVGASLRVVLKDLDVEEIVAHPATAYTEITISDLGTVSTSPTPDNNGNSPFTWMLTGSASDYDVMWDGGTDVPAGASVGVWLPMSSGPYTWSFGPVSATVKTRTQTVRIRDSATLTELATASWSMFAESTL